MLAFFVRFLAPGHLCYLKVNIKTHKGNFMNFSHNELFNGLYSIGIKLNSQQFQAAIMRCLVKAEILAKVATIIDFEAFNNEMINNYFWTLSDIIYEARWLFEKSE